MCSSRSSQDPTTVKVNAAVHFLLQGGDVYRVASTGPVLVDVGVPCFKDHGSL